MWWFLLLVILLLYGWSAVATLLTVCHSCAVYRRRMEQQTVVDEFEETLEEIAYLPTSEGVDR